MKITDLKTLVVNAVMSNGVFVKVETGQPGLREDGQPGRGGGRTITCVTRY